MRAKVKPEEQMTVEEFLAFYDTRPDGERWELIEGVAYMSPSPTDFHQMMAANLAAWLLRERARTGATWTPLLGVGTRVPISPNSLPQPDVFVKEGPLTGKPTTDDAIVLVEILSKSNTRADQAWRRRVYASIPNCRHYVTLSQSKVTATRHDRDAGWKGTAVTGLGSSLALAALGKDVSIPLAEVYRLTPLGPKE